VILRTLMSITAWLQRPPEPAVDLTAGWSATPATSADLTRLRHTLPTLVAGLSAAHGWTVDGDRKHIWARIDAGSSARRSQSPSVPAPRIPL
jgi:hypothetical protein